MLTSRRAPLVVALAVAAALVLTGCMDEQEQAAFDAVNAARATAGLPALAADEELVAKAQRWADVLAAEGSLRHSELSDELTPGRWGRIAENVGYVGGGGDPVASQQANFAASAGHRGNQLGPYTHGGIGTSVAADGRVFQVQVFAAQR